MCKVRKCRPKSRVGLGGPRTNLSKRARKGKTLHRGREENQTINRLGRGPSRPTRPCPSDNVRPDAPSVEVMLIHGRTLYYWLVPHCPYCGMAHQHGGGRIADGRDEPYRNLGHRCSHCGDAPETLPGRRNGYNLVASTRTPVAARVARGSRTCPRFANTTCPSCRAAQRVLLLEAGTVHEATAAMRGRHHDCTKCGARLILGHAREIVK